MVFLPKRPPSTSQRFFLVAVVVLALVMVVVVAVAALVVVAVAALVVVAITEAIDCWPAVVVFFLLKRSPTQSHIFFLVVVVLDVVLVADFEPVETEVMVSDFVTAELEMYFEVGEPEV